MVLHLSDHLDVPLRERNVLVARPVLTEPPATLRTPLSRPADGASRGGG